MKNLKKNNLLIPLLALFVSGCQSTKNFEIKTLSIKEEGDLNVIEVSSDRVIQECYFMNAEKENNWRHQYVLYLLDDKNEVIPVYYPTNQGKKECLAHFKKVEKVLKTARRLHQPLKLCARDKLEKMTDSKDTIPEFHDFGILGRHDSNYWALTFDTICSEKNCYSISDTWTYSCPGF